MSIRDRSIYISLHNREIRCRRCGSVMTVDDVDYNFEGNFDIYFGCTECNTSCIQKTRYNRLITESWHTEFDSGKYSAIDEELVIKKIVRSEFNET